MVQRLLSHTCRFADERGHNPQLPPPLPPWLSSHCTCCREGEGGGGGGLPSSFWGFVYKNVLKSVRVPETESLVTFLLKMLHISILDWSAAFLWKYQIENWSEIYLTTKHKESEGRWLRRNLSQFKLGVEATKTFFVDNRAIARHLTLSDSGAISELFH